MQVSEESGNANDIIEGPQEPQVTQKEMKEEAHRKKADTIHHDHMETKQLAEAAEGDEAKETLAYVANSPIYASKDDKPADMLFKVAAGVAEAGAYISTSPITKASTKREGNHKRTFYANRKVAIVEELHFQKSGRSLQQQMDKVQSVLKLQVKKVNTIEERGATKGDIDALSKSKVDVSEANLTSLRIETRIREGLDQKLDIIKAEKALKKKVNLVDLKGKVKGFVQPLVHTIIGERLPEAVEETKNGLVQLVKRMFDVDPEQKADMQNVNRLIKANEEAQAALRSQEERHAADVAALRNEVATALAEVRQTANEKLQEQTDFMKREMDSKISEMTESLEKIQSETEAKLTSTVEDLKTKNQKALDKCTSEIKEAYDDFVGRAENKHAKFKTEIDLKYQKDIGSMTQRVERCVEQCKEMGSFFKSVKGRMKELQSAQQGVLVKVDKMSATVGSFESKFDSIHADTQDLRAEDIDIKLAVSDLDNSMKEVRKTLQENIEHLQNVMMDSKDGREALSKRINDLKQRTHTGSTKAEGKVKSLESKMKGQERELAKQIGNQEKMLLDQVRIASQQEADELRDAKQAIERRFVSMNSSIRAKEREIGALRKQALAYQRDVKRIELRIDEGEAKVGIIDKRVKKLHAKNILDKVLGLMKPKGPGSKSKQSPMQKKMLELAAAKKAENQLAEISPHNVGWSTSSNEPIVNNSEGKNANDSEAVGKVHSQIILEINKLRNENKGLLSELVTLRNNYVDLKVQVDDEMMMERKRHESHLDQMKEDLKSRHEEELEVQRQEWEERQSSMRDEYESQIARLSTAHDHVQNQLNEASAVSAVLQAYKNEMLSRQDDAINMPKEAKPSTENEVALQELARLVHEQHEQIHLELGRIRQQSIKLDENIHFRLESMRTQVIDAAKDSAVHHADNHIRNMLHDLHKPVTFSGHGSQITRNKDRTVTEKASTPKTSVNEQNVSETKAKKRGDENDTKIPGTHIKVSSENVTEKDTDIERIILTSQKHQDHRIDILLKQQRVAGREIGILRKGLVELENAVLQKLTTSTLTTSPKSGGGGGRKSAKHPDSSMEKNLKKVEDAVKEARNNILGVATEANEAMKRVVAQTSNVEAFIKKHQNEERRMRAEQEYRHVKELRQMQRITQAHKTKTMLEEQHRMKAHADEVKVLEAKAAEERSAFESVRKQLLDELKQTRQEKETAQMLAQRLSEKQTKLRLMAAKAKSNQKGQANSTSSDNIGNFVGKGGAMYLVNPAYRGRAESKELVPHGEAKPDLENSLEIMKARTPNVLGYSASESGSDTSMGTSKPTEAMESLQTPGHLIAAAGLGDVTPTTSTSLSVLGDENPWQKYGALHTNLDTVSEGKLSPNWDVDSIENEQQHKNHVIKSTDLNKIEKKHEKVAISITELQDKFGELDFGSKNNRRLITAINERFSQEIKSLKDGLAYIPDVRAIESRLYDLMGTMKQIKNQSTEILNLKSENAQLANELKRRQIDSRGNFLEHGNSPLTKQRRVMQLASSHSDPNFTLPGLFKLGTG